MTAVLQLTHAPVSWWRDDFLTWLVGISTAVGVAAAIAAGIFAALAYQREVARDKARDAELRQVREQERRAVASLVALWLTPKRTFRRDEAPPVVNIRNASPLPIYSVRVKWYGVNDDRPVLIQDIGVVPPGEEHRSYPLEPVDEACLGELVARAKRDEQTRVTVQTELWFHDPSGVGWIRDDSGYLSERREQDEWQPEPHSAGRKDQYRDPAPRGQRGRTPAWSDDPVDDPV